MLEKILVPLDGSSLAECVLRHVVALDRVFNSEVTLLHVLERHSDSKLSTEDPIDWYLQKAEAETYLERLQSQLNKAGLQVNCVLLEGTASQQIIDYCHTHEMDLIVLSTHGNSGLSRWNINSVANKIIMSAHTSLMIIRAYSEEQSREEYCYDRIFIPLDGSTRAECVLSIASSLACQEHGELILSHVVSPPRIFHRMPLTPEEQEQIDLWTKRDVDAVTKYLNDLQTRLSVNNSLQINASDDVIETLHEMVEQQEEPAELIILSAHGTSGKRRWPFGSLVTSFINYGTCPLLIVQDMHRDEIEPTQADIVIRSRDQNKSRITNHAQN